MLEVSWDISTAKEVKCPLVLDRCSKLFPTWLVVCGVVKWFIPKWISLSIWSDWHCNLVASKNIPSVSVKVASSFCVWEVSAWYLTSKVVINIDCFKSCFKSGCHIWGDLSSCDWFEKRIYIVVCFIKNVSFFDIFIVLAWCIYWPGWHRLQETRFIRIVGHSHVCKSIHQVSIKISNIFSRVDVLARLESSRDCFPVFLRVLKSFQISKGLLHSCVAFHVRKDITKWVRNDNVECLRVSCALEIKNRSWCSQSTLDCRRVLHAHPCGEHASIRATERDDRLVFNIPCVLDFFQEKNVVHHNLFYCKVPCVLWSEW